MQERTCAACDYPLDDNAIQVTIGGRTVEACCEECAQKLREAGEAARNHSRRSTNALPAMRRRSRCGGA
jgi:xanthine/CO dehydrogenase XdhC/CoxF family maturation factor